MGIFQNKSLEKVRYVSMKPAKWLLLALIVFLPSCGSDSEKKTASTPPAPATPTSPTAAAKPEPTPLGDMAIPADNPMTPEKVALGKQLFFDKRLSKDGQMSCETCHVPEKGWADGQQLSTRADGTKNTRHTPTLINVGFYNQWYWDGRAATLEGQVLAAWKGQMSGDPDQTAMTLNGIDAYKNAFQTAMGGPATPDSITKALAAFVRTIRSENAPWDRYEKGDKSAVSEDAIEGNKIFTANDKANCTLCHLPPLYTDTLYHNIGVGFDKPSPDPGRGKILGDQAQQRGSTNEDANKLIGAFKTPTLRGVTEHPPYFHDGSKKTLEESVDFILKGGIKNPNLDEKLMPRKLSPKERTQLLAFVKSLTEEQKPYERPKLP
jgi:cytochrome c peroxidase